jgi:hypothetical protein
VFFGNNLQASAFESIEAAASTCGGGLVATIAEARRDPEPPP